MAQWEEANAIQVRDFMFVQVVCFHPQAHSHPQLGVGFQSTMETFDTVYT